MVLKKLIKKLIPKPFKTIAKYWLGISAFDHVAIANNGLHETIINLDKKYRFYKPTLVRFLIDFYRYLASLDFDLAAHHEKKFMIIHCCCWGDSYADKMNNYFLASLLSPNNLPKIAESFETMMLIHCDQSTKEKLLHSPVVEKLKHYVTLKFIIVPDHLLSMNQADLSPVERFAFKKANYIDTFKYIVLGGLQTHAFEIALKAKAHISFMMPDVILSDAFFSEMTAEIKTRKALVSTTFRTNYQKIRETTKRFYQHMEGTVLSVPASVLTALQVENIHEAAKRRIVSEATANFSACAQLIFEAKKGFIVRSFHYHPILINCAQLDTEIKMDYFPIDNSVLNQIVSDQAPCDQQVIVCNDRSKLAWIELSDDDIESNFSASQAVTQAELLEIFRDMILKEPSLFDTPLNQYFFSVRNEVYSNNVDNQHVFIDDRQFVVALNNELQRAKEG